MSVNLQGVLIKKAYQQEEYTERHLTELAECVDAENGYFNFATKHFYIQHPKKGKLLFEPFEYQVKLLHSYHNYRMSVNLLPRQSGKTTTAAGYLLWYAMFVPDQTILIAAHKYTGAQEIMQRIRYGYESCPDHIRCGVVNYNKGSIEFDNGSRIVSATTTSNTGRGMSISLLYVDEMGFLNPSIAEEFWTSIRPTLATGGKAIITSTPNSDEDQFAQIWRESQNKFDAYGNETVDGTGINGFYGYQAFWWEHPDRDEAWKIAEVASISEERFRREYGCEFLIDEETLINSIKLSDIKVIDPIYKTKDVRWYKRPTAGNTYVVAWDPSLGTGGDNSAIEVFELPGFIQVAEWKNNVTSITDQARILREILIEIDKNCENDYNNIYWTVENNTVGESALIVINDFREETFPGTFMSEPPRKGHVKKYRKGFNTTYGSKISTCSRLKTLVENDKFVIQSKALLSELKTYVASGASFKAKSGSTDDLVSAVLLIIRMSVLLADWFPDVTESISMIEDDEWEPPMPIYVSF